jgi:hypothetical protein
MKTFSFRTRALAVSCSLFAFLPAAWSQSFFPLKAPECLTDVSSLFTIGGQYVDGYPANGVPAGYSMLTRWQGDIAPVSYPLGTWTNLYVSPTTTYQRGWQPEDPLGSPGTQIYCAEAGMMLNTWPIRHRRIEGGGYNDMYGYSWGSSGPPAFRDDYGTPSDLVVQVSAAVPLVWENLNKQNPMSRPYPVLDVTLFAYLKDLAHPGLHEIAIIGSIAANERKSFPDETVTPLYGDAYVTKGIVSIDYPNGIFFASGAVRTSTPFTTVIYTGAQAREYPNRWDQRTTEPLQFYRMHVTPKNLVQIVDAIQALPCPNGCPAKGYSRNPNDYIVTYAGLLSEVTVLDCEYSALRCDPPAPQQFVANDPNKDQMAAAVRLSGLGIYRAIPANSFRTGVVTLTNAYYEKILGRIPDTGGREYWAGTVLSQGDAPSVVQKFREMGTGMFQSAEYYYRYRANGDYVFDLYRGLLGRDPESGGFAYWVGQLNAGADRYSVLMSFLYSQEYYQYTYGAIY